MTANGILQLAVYLIVLLALARLVRRGWRRWKDKPNKDRPDPAWT